MSDEILNDVFSTLNKNSFIMPNVVDSNYENSDILEELDEIGALCRKPNFYTTSGAMIKSNIKNTSLSSITIIDDGYYFIQVKSNSRVALYVVDKATGQCYNWYFVQSANEANGSSLNSFEMYLLSGWTLNFQKYDHMNDLSDPEKFETTDYIVITKLPFI